MLSQVSVRHFSVWKSLYFLKIKHTDHQIGEKAMNKKTIYIVVAVLVVVIIVGVAGVMLLSKPGGSTNPSATPTPTASPTTIVGANTVQFSVNDTTTGVTYMFACKAFNTTTEIVRVDIPGATGNYSYILNVGEMKSWSNTAGTWAQDASFDPSGFATAFTDYVDRLAASGSTNDLSFTKDGASYTVYCVAVNPTLADSLFATS